MGQVRAGWDLDGGRRPQDFRQYKYNNKSKGWLKRRKERRDIGVGAHIRVAIWAVEMKKMKACHGSREIQLFFSEGNTWGGGERKKELGRKRGLLGGRTKT